MEFIKVTVEPINLEGGKISGINGLQRDAFIPISKIKAVMTIPGGSNTIIFEDNLFKSMNLKFISLSDDSAKIYQWADCVQYKK
jgi:hypothetical protein